MQAIMTTRVNEQSLFSLPCHFAIAVPICEVDYESTYFLLSDDEKKRVDSFKSKTDSACYNVAHSLKRYCLSGLLNIEPQLLVFSSGDKGKPFCEQAQGIDFNLSHSAGWVLLGVSSLATIGVDIEKADRKISKKVIDYALTHEQILSISEAGCEASSRDKKAITYWTQKEAISKSVGGGISVGFKNIKCSGSVGASKAYCREQEFLVQSHYFKDVVFSVANSLNTAVDIYCLSQWGDQSKESLSLEKLF